mmetsp:Transcript_22219/g.48299  ORF Transcript_22219/g.48299 Transcript_22219/m.48299 type:complete len:127 (-) Transcript_22219:899-1279(-)
MDGVPLQQRLNAGPRQVPHQSLRQALEASQREAEGRAEVDGEHIERLDSFLASRGLQRQPVARDGNCWCNVISAQLQLQTLGISDSLPTKLPAAWRQALDEMFQEAVSTAPARRCSSRYRQPTACG